MTKIDREVFMTEDNQENNKVLEEQTNIEQSNKQEVDLEYKSKSEVFKGGILGLIIGLAIIVPGVSGSAVSIIFGMYEKLLYSISNLFKSFKSCFKFLFPILIGGVIGLVIGFFGVRALLNILPFIVICLFAGLMLGAYPAVTNQIKGTKKSVKNIILFILGLIIPIIMSSISVFGNFVQQTLVNLQFYHYLIFVFLGFLVAITQLVPGLSATAVLMAFGYFTSLMNSVSLTNFREHPEIFLVYLALIIGFVLGLFIVSKLLSFLMKNYKIPTFYMVAGLSLGSIITMFFNPEVIDIYTSWGMGGNLVRDLCVGIPLFILGVIISFLFVRFEEKKKINVSKN